MSQVSVFDRSEEKTMRWVKDVATGRGSTDMRRSYKILRAVLHATRDRLMPEEAVQLGAQLPMLVRGFYYEGWHPHDKPKRYRQKAPFLAQVDREAPGLDDVQLERAVTAVFQTLESEMPGSELDQVRHALPVELRELWPTPGM
jgi:uncharacterized protein (DUF2267 family)